MNNSTLSGSAVFLSLLAGLTIGSGAVVAQQAGQGLEEITVVAPRAVTRETVGRTNVGGKVELISLTRHVDYSDLDLAAHADVMELQKRVDDIAKESCEDLAKMYPLSESKTPDCVKEAVASAKSQVDKAVMAAEKR